VQKAGCVMARQLDTWTGKEVGPRLEKSLGHKTGARNDLCLDQGPFLFLLLFLPHASDCGSLIIITIMLKWQNGKLCAKCIKFIAHWPRQWPNRFVFVIVSVSVLLAHVFFFICEFHASALVWIAGQKLGPKRTWSQWDTCGGRSRFCCAGQWISGSASVGVRVSSDGDPNSGVLQWNVTYNFTD